MVWTCRAQARGGRPYVDQVGEALHRPLKMDHSTIRPTLALTFPLAVGHRTVEGAPAVVRPVAEDSRQWPAGGLFSSANDLAALLVTVNTPLSRASWYAAVAPGRRTQTCTAFVPPGGVHVSVFVLL